MLSWEAPKPTVLGLEQHRAAPQGCGGGVGDRRGPTPVQLVPSVLQTSQDICCVVFAIFNVIWATLFLEEWKRRGAEFAYKWGTLDTPAESIEEPRPQFRVSPGRGGSHAWGGVPGAGVQLSPSLTLTSHPWGVCAGSHQCWGHGGIPWGGSHAAMSHTTPPPPPAPIRALRESAL